MSRIPQIARAVALGTALVTLLGAPAAAAPSYADVADLTLAAPTLVRATITKVERISGQDSPGLAPGSIRLLITAAVNASLIAPGAIPSSLQWLWDAPLDTRGRAPKAKGLVVLAWLGAPAADGKTQLVARGAQLPWDAATEATARAIAIEARSGTVPVVTGVRNGFRADGTIPGESESQFFLTTRDGKDVAMVVTTKPGEVRRVAIARGDVIDESAAKVVPGTLLHYRLACFLAPTLPATIGDPALAVDWRAALQAIGPCGRSPRP